MNDFVDSFAYWLADYYLAAMVLLAATLVAIRLCRQPVKRLAVTKAAIVAIAVLTGLLALPGWSVVSLGPPDTMHEAELSTTDIAPLVDTSRNVPAAIESPQSSVVVSAPVAAANETLQARETMPISWPAVVVVTYLVGLVGIVLWLVVGAIAARRLVRRAQPAPAKLSDLFRRTIGGRSQLAELLVSEEIDVAVALGVFRPRVLLPQDWANSRAAEELSTVLAHEAAHTRNGDLIWLTASRLLLVVLWAQPLYWMLRRSLRLDQEALADAAAADHVGRQQYAEQLVAWAREVATRPRPLLPAAMGLWEGPSQLRRRIVMLLDERFTIVDCCPNVWKLTTTAIVVTLATILSTATLEPSAVGEAVERDAASNSGQLAGVRALPTGAKVEVLAIGSNLATETPERWWRPDGTPLVSAPFRVGGGSVSPSDDQVVRQFVFRVSEFPPGTTVRWQVIDSGSGYWAEVEMNGKENPPGYYSDVFCVVQDQASFGLSVDVAVGNWKTVTRKIPSGGVSIGLSNGKSVALTQAFSINAPQWGESSAVVISHNFVGQDVRMIAIDKAGKQHTAGRSSSHSTGEATPNLTQFDFLGLKTEDVDHFELQTRDFESVQFNELPTQPDTNLPAVEFQALEAEGAAPQE
jgi:beta-lactamase regulating signal transducer with metallopeptidase domain